MVSTSRQGLRGQEIVRMEEKQKGTVAVDRERRKARTSQGEVRGPFIPFPEDTRDTRGAARRLPGLGLQGVLGLGRPGDGTGADKGKMKGLQ